MDWVAGQQDIGKILDQAEPGRAVQDGGVFRVSVNLHSNQLALYRKCSN
jgi:hypothetical protein